MNYTESNGSNSIIIEDNVEGVFCDGTQLKKENGSDLSPHPGVFLNISKNGNVTCPYCDTKFQYSEDE